MKRLSELSPDEVEYKKLLRDTILEIAELYLEEHREEIIKRAIGKIEFLKAHGALPADET